MTNHKRIPITQLQPGQYVLDISQQLGHMKVSMAGWVRSQHAINELLAKGIISVTIDTEQKLFSEQDDTLSFDEKFGKVSFEKELEAAKSAVNKLTNELARAFALIRKEDLIDTNALHFATMEFIASSYRNSAAVLSLVRVTHYTDFQLGHALRCAAYFAAMLRHLKWSTDVAQNWIMGALLHDMGKLLMPESVQQPNSKSLTQQQREQDAFVMPEHITNGIEIAEFVGSLTQETLEII